MQPPSPPRQTKSSSPLADFQKIGHNTFLWTPATYLSHAARETPLILLFSWNGAAAKHIAKYTSTYRTLFPHARMLLVTCFTRDMFRRSASYAALLAPALDVVCSHTRLGGAVLCHSFSNGGGNQVNEFAKAWKAHFTTKLPLRLHVLDSSPTKGAWMRSHAAISASLPRSLFWKWFGAALVHVLLACTWLVNLIRWRENKMVVLCRELNDADAFDRRVPRVYLYSRADSMVGFEEVEEHAEIARRKGWHVTKVVFEKSAHCSHVREDESRYWDAVMGAWKKASRAG